MEETTPNPSDLEQQFICSWSAASVRLGRVDYLCSLGCEWGHSWAWKTQHGFPFMSDASAGWLGELHLSLRNLPSSRASLHMAPLAEKVIVPFTWQLASKMANTKAARPLKAKAVEQCHFQNILLVKANYRVSPEPARVRLWTPSLGGRRGKELWIFLYPP